MANSNLVVVVGAGPTGLATACGLRAGGVPVRVVDRAHGPTGTSRALGLQPRGAEVLDRLGALADLPRRSVTIQAVRITVAGRPLARLRVGQPTKLVTRPGLLMSQSEVEAALRARLQELGCAVEWGREVRDVTKDTSGLTVGLTDGEALRAAWLVGCDGAGSAVRKAAGISFPGVSVIERFLLADVHADLGLPRDEVAVWLHGEEMLGAFPLPDGVWRLMAPAPASTPDGLDSAGVAQVMGELLTTRAGIPAGAVRSTSWTSTFRIHRRMVDSYRRGRVLLAGDAAHIHSPFGGQGMNTGLGDAENLAFKLALVATGRAAPALLDTYEAERRPVAAEVLASTTALTRLVLGGSPLARAVRDHMFVPLLNRPRVQRMIWERSSQLMTSYRGGPLSPHRAIRLPGRGPQPGDRVADLPCLRADGTPTRLHAALGPAWVLLAPPTAAARLCAAAARRRLGSDILTVLAPAAASGPVLLVRPDAHLGWRGHRPGSLDRWLTRVLAPHPTS